MKTRIAVLGIGGVGGYFGGLLAKKYSGSAEVEIIFICKSESENIISKNGLKLITPQTEEIIFPHLVSGNAEAIGVLDYLICTVKSYDLEDSLKPLSSCINSQTVILPLLNGIDSKERINIIYPKAQVWEGCAYIISRLIEPGVVKEAGSIHTIHFGSNEAEVKKLKQFENILRAAGIEVFLSSNILSTIWEKFLFISTIASLTSYLDLPIGKILEGESNMNLLNKLLAELKNIAEAKNIILSENCIDKTISVMKNLPYETTSSMHSDFKKGGKTEYISLTENVVKLARKLKINAPAYNMVLEGIKYKTNKNT